MTQNETPGKTNSLPLAIFVAGIIIIAIAVVAGIILSNGSGDGSDAEPVIFTSTQVTIEIQDFEFNPPNASVPQGATVTWRNLDSAPHDAKDDDDDWTTPIIQQDSSASLNFTTPGTYTYHCSIHPYMKATLTVREESAASPTGE